MSLIDNFKAILLQNFADLEKVVSTLLHEKMYSLSVLQDMEHFVLLVLL